MADGLRSCANSAVYVLLCEIINKFESIKALVILQLTYYTQRQGKQNEAGTKMPCLI